MNRMDFYNRFKEEVKVDWSVDLYTQHNIGEDGSLLRDSYVFSSSYTEGLYAGYCLANNPSTNMSYNFENTAPLPARIVKQVPSL